MASCYLILVAAVAFSSSAGTTQDPRIYLTDNSGYVRASEQQVALTKAPGLETALLTAFSFRDGPAALGTKVTAVEEGCCLSLWLLIICRNLGGCDGFKYSLSLPMWAGPGRKRWFLRQSRDASHLWWTRWPSERPFSTSSTQEQSPGQENAWKTVIEFTGYGDPVPGSPSQDDVIVCRWALYKWENLKGLRSKMWWSGNISRHQRPSQYCWKFNKQPWEPCLCL